MKRIAFLIVLSFTLIGLSNGPVANPGGDPPLPESCTIYSETYSYEAGTGATCPLSYGIKFSISNPVSMDETVQVILHVEWVTAEGYVAVNTTNAATYYVGDINSKIVYFDNTVEAEWEYDLAYNYTSIGRGSFIYTPGWYLYMTVEHNGVVLATSAGQYLE